MLMVKHNNFNDNNSVKKIIINIRSLKNKFAITRCTVVTGYRAGKKKIA